MKGFLKKLWSILFIFLILFIFASPYFLKGKVPYASTYQVNFFPPWSSYEKFWGPVKNNAMPDVHTQIYPWKKFTIEVLKKGQIPLWNPYSFSGNPHLANSQSAVLSPFNFLFLVIPFIDAWSILVLLQPLLAGLFMYLLTRAYGIGKIGCLISSISFMFSGFIVVWMAYGTLPYAILYLPLAFFAIERYYASKRLRFLLLLSVTIPLSFFSGHFQISLYFFTAVFSYIIFKGLTTQRILTTFYLIFSSILGIILSLPQLLSSIELYLQSIRSEIFQVIEAIPFSYFVTIIAPDFFGNPVTRNDWFGHYAEWAGFIGAWPFVLALYALFRRKDKTIFYFGFLGAMSLILAVNSPLSSLFVSLKLPVLSTSALSRIIVIFSFSFAALSGFGFDAMVRDLQNKRFKLIFTLLVLSGGFFAAIWLLLFAMPVLPEQWLIVAKRNFVLPSILFIGGAVMITLSSTHKKFILFTTLYLLFAISFDSLRFAQKWMPFDPKELVYPNVPIIKAIKQHVGDGRIFGNIGAEVSTYYGIPSVEGYDPLYIGRYGEFIRGAGTGEFLKGERSVVKLDRRGKYTDRVLDLLGVSLIFHPIADTNQGWAYPVWEDEKRYSLVYQDDKFQLFKNNQVMPRASVFYELEVVSASKDIIKRLSANDFDYRRKLILEENVAGIVAQGTGSAQITEYSPNRVEVKVESNQPGLLFLSDNYYPGWKVKVNGREEKIYRADYTFRAVVVPKGNSVVEFSYGLFF